MERFTDKLQTLKAMAFQDHENDERYKQIRVDMINLLADAQKTLPQEQFLEFKSDVMHVLYEICGTHLDLEVLKDHTAGILSNADFETIIQNSALTRWM